MTEQLPPRALLRDLAYRLIHQQLDGEHFVVHVSEIPLLVAAIDLVEPVERLHVEIEGYRRALAAHHNLATLSQQVLDEYDFRECPVCKRARSDFLFNPAAEADEPGR